MDTCPQDIANWTDNRKQRKNRSCLSSPDDQPQSKKALLGLMFTLLMVRSPGLSLRTPSARAWCYFRPWTPGSASIYLT